MAPPPVSSFALDRAFPHLKKLIVERTGHFYYIDKDDLLWERIRKRLRATGNRDCATYLERLDDTVLGAVEWARLEAEITIGETFFFRYAEQFTALREVILPEIIARKDADRRLRIWSAGCATGAEAYSVAILVSELLGETLKDWRVSILGTDINDNFLEIARKGRFGPWALRSVTPEQKAAYFVQAVEREQWHIRPEYRSLARFERHNLLSLLDGTSPLQFTDFDLILCRNVLIYFHPEIVNRIVGALRNTLVYAGWILVGHAEPNPGFAELMQVVNLPGTTAYRNLPPSNSPWRSPSKAEPQTASAWILPRSIDSTPSSTKPPDTKTHIPDAPTTPTLSEESDASVVEVRRLADAGAFTEAEAVCERGLVERPIDPVLHLYRGLVAQVRKRAADAEKAFRDSIYLDRNFVMAHYHLGLHLIATGQRESGLRSISNAARIAASLPSDHPLAEADGLTAGEFKALARVHLAPVSRGRSKR